MLVPAASPDSRWLKVSDLRRLRLSGSLSLSAAVGSRFLGHGLHRVPGPVPGRLGPVYLHQFPRTSETSVLPSGRERPAERAGRRDPQAPGGASEGGSESVLIPDDPGRV